MSSTIRVWRRSRFGNALIDEATAESEADDVAGVVEVELFHDTAAVGFDGIDAEVKSVSDFFVGLSDGDHGEDFAFATGEEIDRVGDVSAVVGKDGVGDGRA